MEVGSRDLSQIITITPSLLAGDIKLTIPTELLRKYQFSDEEKLELYKDPNAFKVSTKNIEDLVSVLEKAGLSLEQIKQTVLKNKGLFSLEPLKLARIVAALTELNLEEILTHGLLNRLHNIDVVVARYYYLKDQEKTVVFANANLLFKEIDEKAFERRNGINEYMLLRSYPYDEYIKINPEDLLPESEGPRL